MTFLFQQVRQVAQLDTVGLFAGAVDTCFDKAGSGGSGCGAVQCRTLAFVLRDGCGLP